jgi:long-chain fatty acid transport protein
MNAYWRRAAVVRRCQTVAFVLVLAFVLSVQVQAAGFRNPPEGANALGKIGGKVAFIDDPSAISHNPANLVEIQKPETLAALTIVRARTDFTAPNGVSAETDDPWKFLPNLYAVWPFSGAKLVGGIGITTPFGQSTEWSDDSIFRNTAPYFAQLRVVNVNPTIATKLGDRVSLGAGADVFLSDIRLKQVYPWSSLAGPAAQDGQADFDGDGVGGGANIGLTVQCTDRQRVALTYRSPVKVDYNGDFKISGLPPAAFLPPPLQAATSRSDFDTEITFPAVAALGYGIQATKALRCEANIGWVQFSKYDSLTLDAGNNNVLLLTTDVSQDWKDVWTFGVGGDLQVNPNTVLRAGYIFLQSPVPDHTLAPTLPDADRHVISVGVGYKRGAQSLDLAYAYSIFDERDIEANQNPAYNGEYDNSSHILGVSWGYIF